MKTQELATTSREGKTSGVPEPLLPPVQARVAYFSMEIALDERIPTYSGGLGILAGDTIRSAADLGVPMVAVTLLHRKGIRPKARLNGSRRSCSRNWSPSPR